LVGNKLKELRTARGYTIVQLCELLDMNPNTYAKYERDERDVSTDTLVKVADFYRVTTDYLLGREPQANPFASLNLQMGEEEAMAKYAQLPEEVRMIILDVMIQLSEAAKSGMVRKEQPPIIMIQRHRSKASAGGGYDLRNEDEWENVQVLADGAAENADFVVEVEGNSMLPDYQDGDLVLIVLDADVPVGKVGLFRQGDKGYIKERGEDRLISRNPDFEDIYGEVECIGRVIGIAELPE